VNRSAAVQARRVLAEACQCVTGERCGRHQRLETSLTVLDSCCAQRSLIGATFARHTNQITKRY
jgi:hypothetical protein